MNYLDAFKFLQTEIHTTVIATIDDLGFPVTCAIDLMDYDEKGLYFLTAKGKGFYHRLLKKGYLSLTGLKGETTLSCISISLQGKVKEVKENYIERLLSKNQYMYEIYPTKEARTALAVFQIYAGKLEWFDLSKKPIERYTFTFGDEKTKKEGFYITEACTCCRKCLAVCPQNCIEINTKAHIKEENCLHCGNCQWICPSQAVNRW